MSPKLLLAFFAAEFLISLSPGPAVFLVVSQGMRHGFRPSLRGIGGILVGDMVFFALSAFGLTALLAGSAPLFEAIRWAGVAYLIFVGVKMMAAKAPPEETMLPGLTEKPGRLFLQGLSTQLSNPKAILYFAALLPQFITPAQAVLPQFLVLGLLSLAIESVLLGGYALLAERGAAFLRGRFAFLRERVAGACFIGAGLGLALARKP